MPDTTPDPDTLISGTMFFNCQCWWRATRYSLLYVQILCPWCSVTTLLSSSGVVLIFGLHKSCECAYFQASCTGLCIIVVGEELQVMFRLHTYSIPGVYERLCSGCYFVLVRMCIILSSLLYGVGRFVAFSARGGLLSLACSQCEKSQRERCAAHKNQGCTRHTPNDWRTDPVWHSKRSLSLYVVVIDVRTL